MVQHPTNIARHRSQSVLPVDETGGPGIGYDSVPQTVICLDQSHLTPAERIRRSISQRHSNYRSASQSLDRNPVDTD